MALNKDGLEPGAPVDFVTLKRIQREQRTAKPKPAPVKRGPKPKQADSD